MEKSEIEKKYEELDNHWKKIINPASKHAAQAIKLFKDVFDNENRLRKFLIRKNF